MYEYVDINEVKVGDVVEYQKDHNKDGDLMRGVLSVVLRVRLDDSIVITSKMGGCNGLGFCNLKLLKTEHGETTKIGDKVLCISDKEQIGQDWEVDKVYTIVEGISASGNCRAKGANWNDVRNFVVLSQNTSFNLKILNENIIVNCRTKEQADILLNWATRNGKTWGSGGTYIDNTKWGDYEVETCYFINRGSYGNLPYHAIENKNIWTYEDALCMNI